MIVGIDEVGRGCWAGPVVAGAVALAVPIEGLKDSKKLNRAQREKLDVIIREKAAGFGIGWVAPEEVDEIGLTAAVGLAMRRAVEQIEADFDEIIVDGNYNFLAHDARAVCVIKADDSVPAVSAASIIAKVARDNYMGEMAAKHPGYGFENHVGYGTAVHAAALKVQGICKLHRKSFAPIRKFLEAA